MKEESFATSAGHWYKLDGTPSYTAISKDGSERSYNLRDAKKDKDRVPSVTTILKVAVNTGLEEWIRNNLLMAAATLPRIEGESADDWVKRVKHDARQQGQDAASLGTKIHGSLEKAYNNEIFDRDHDLYVGATLNAILKSFPDQNWSAERSFANKMGFGGKIDLSSSEMVIDFKTSAKVEEKKDSELGYDEHLMQLSAYAYGLGIQNPRCANVYVSTTQPGHVRVKEWAKDDIDRGLEMFFCLLKFWKLKNKFTCTT